MGPNDLDTVKLLSPLVDIATCLDCCKLYIAPETASCGHTFCHTCWRKRRSCLCCAAPLDRRTLKLNGNLQNITEHVQNMCEEFEKYFHFKVDTFSVGDGVSRELESEPDPTKNVNEWLASSQNHFSAPISSESTQDIVVEHLTSTVQVHSHTKKVITPRAVVHRPPAQEDWEKIEHLPDTDDQVIKQSKVMDGSLEYSTEHPRRSSRKRELKHDEYVPNTSVAPKDICSSKDSSTEIDPKITKTKQNWKNVKKMRKEFSKLNKLNRNKLNISIEMCKKAKANGGKANSTVDNTASDPIPEKLLEIEDDTPNDLDKITNNNNTEKQLVQSSKCSVPENNVNKNNNNECLISSTKNNSIEICNENLNTNDNRNIINHEINKSELNNDIKKTTKIPFYKKNTFHINDENAIKSNLKTMNYNIDCTSSSNTDDIEITIKIGDTVANIFFKRKKNDEPHIVNVNQEIQTSIGIHTLDDMSNYVDENLQNIAVNKDNEQIANVVEVNKLSHSKEPVPDLPDIIQKSVSTKKNTASAETVTAQFEITESVEKELSSVMEIAEQEESSKQHSEIILTKSVKSANKYCNSTQQQLKENTNIEEHIDSPDYINDMDIFESGSVREGNVNLLKDTKNTPSEIIPTMKTVKGKTQNKPKKRDREDIEVIEMANKKQKVLQDSPKVNSNVELDTSLQKEFAHDSEGVNYDAIMGQVFANIDADIHNTNDSKHLMNHTQVEESPSIYNKTAQGKSPEKEVVEPINVEDSADATAGGESESVFTVLEKENESNEVDVQRCEARSPARPEAAGDDDRSVVEDTPQKTVSFTKPRNKSENVQVNTSMIKQKISGESDSAGAAEVSDAPPAGSLARQHSETPLTINKFVDQIKHKSTPVARKSLNFENDAEDAEQTLCPTAEPAATTQERELMSRVFERSPRPAEPQRPAEPYRLAGSCLSSAQLARLRALCRRRGWHYCDKYSDRLTHLVVGVDEDNRSQRSVKYMCALAASKWIVSSRWVDACLAADAAVREEPFEALDGTGSPGPRRSRRARGALFRGLTFHCLPPFSILDVHTLKRMLEAAGGEVAADVGGVRVEAGGGPRLLLAEPEDTQENKFIYMAVELCVVPVNYEWVLNCLGAFRLRPLGGLLLCPPPLLPPAAAAWPAPLLEDDDELLP